MKRPWTATVLAILAVIAAILAIFDALRYSGILPIAALGPLNFFGVSFVGVILSVIVALIWLSVARQLWNVDPQGWLFVVVIAIVYLIFDLVAVLGGSSFQAVLPSVVVNAVALILAVLPNTRASFGQK
jgi:hypothetical protein